MIQQCELKAPNGARQSARSRERHRLLNCMPKGIQDSVRRARERHLYKNMFQLW